MSRNEKAIGIALVMYVLYWAVYVMKGGNFCMPAVQLAEEFIGSLIVVGFFWMVSWILLSPDPDREAMEDSDKKDDMVKLLAVLIESNSCDLFDPYSALAAEKLGVSYHEFIKVFHDDTHVNHERYTSVRKDVKVAALKLAYGGQVG